MNEGKSPLTIARECLRAYVDKDRTAIETMLAEDYRFTSPIDNGLDRKTYLQRCWPNSEFMDAFDFVYAMEFDNHALVVYEARTSLGKRFRNCEVHTVRDGKLVSTEVYFGWDLPHRAPPEGFIENNGAGHA
jgi:hypothetical protein